MLKLGTSVQSVRVFEGNHCNTYREPSGKLRMASADILNKTRSLDISWLPLAAEQYNISGDIRDYVINEIPIVAVDMPNRNMDSFPFEEVSSFNTEIGRVVYQTFIGKPTHKDHDNRDPRKARGVHFDAQLEKIGNSNLYKITVLAGWDRTKDPELVKDILSGARNAYSMGALVGYTQCSYPGCEATSTNGRVACNHLQYGKGKGRVVNGHVIYEQCRKCNFIETSSVSDPAQYDAVQRWKQAWV